MAANADMPYLDPHNMTQLQSLVTLVGGKPFHEFTVPEQRDLFSKVQWPQPENPEVAISHHMIKTSHGEVKTYLYMPKGVTEPVPLVYFVHGGGWIYGDAGAFAAFLIELADKSKLAVVVPEYTLAPERKFPAQQEQCLEVLQDVLKVGPGHGLITDRVVVAGDSSGGKLDNSGTLGPV
jgi:acetyl esterase/lipase